MPPRKSRRIQDSTGSSTSAQPAVSLNPLPAGPGAPENNQIALVALPQELLNEIVDNFETLPSDYYYDTARNQGFPSLEFYEREDLLRALSQTCRALRVLALPRLWERLDTCRVPEHRASLWYKYIMEQLLRKATAMANSQLRVYVRTLTIMLSKSNPNPTLSALSSLLSSLPNLKKIHIINCKTPGFAQSLSGVSLPTVTTLFLPTNANFIVKLCPNVKHVKCVQDDGSSLISALKTTTGCEVFDGMVDWRDVKMVDRLVKSAPDLKTLELRRPVNHGLGINSQNTAPEEWVTVIPKLSLLKNLSTLILTFPGEEELDSDLASIEAARKVVKNFKGEPGEKRLVVRRVIAPHYSNEYKSDFLSSSTTEVY